MTLKKISRVFVVAIVVVAIGQLFNATDVAAGLFGTRLMDQTGCSRRCPACDYVCNLNAEQVEEEKPCFDVETKVICIPRVVFPWQKKKVCGSCDACDGRGCNSCVQNGARTRKVCVLKSDKYKCPKCQYTWTAEKSPCGTPCDADCAAIGWDTAAIEESASELAPAQADSQSDDAESSEKEQTVGVLQAPAQS